MGGMQQKERYDMKTNALILATGHSSRDTFRMLHAFGLPMQAKSFAVGLRMEHPQAWINAAMYGKNCPYEMETAPYKVTHKCENGRGVYSFCMCPGGYVVNASSESGRLAVNGMTSPIKPKSAAKLRKNLHTSKKNTNFAVKFVYITDNL